MASGPITSWQISGEMVETVADFNFGGSKITADGDCSHEIKRHLPLGRKGYDQPRQHIIKQRHQFANKGPPNQSYGFSSSHVWMEKAMAPHSSTLAWKILWTEEPGRLQSMGSLKSDTTERLHFHFSLSCIGEGNGNPLQCSCLENPRDGGAWWAAVCGVAQSWTRLKRLSSSSMYEYERWTIRKAEC